MNDGCLGCLMIETSPVTLRTGIVVCTSCNDWRNETEARMVVKMPDKSKRTEYLQSVDKQRGEAAGKMLRDEVRAQWDERTK